jgi:2-dehydro-3-deoxygalactonokinase
MAGELSQAALIAVDWGTSRLRAFLVDREGNALAEADSEDGISRLSAGQHEAAFARLTKDWPKVPALMAGMIGSRQGWREAAYLPCPASPAGLAERMLRFPGPDGRPLAIVPGVMLRSSLRDGDVIRGEETQIIGLLGRDPGFEGVVILPGTHSKWATVGGGALADFQTFLTGEMFELLSRTSFLRHSVAEGSAELATLPDFELAVRRTVTEGLPFLAAIFSVRVRQLLDDVAREDNLAYLSGLVIGGEIAAAKTTGRLMPGAVPRIIGNKSLARAYRKAFEIAGHRTETLDGKEMVLAGLTHLARVTGLLPGKG